MKKISFLLAFFVMISAATFANTTHLTLLNAENPVVKKLIVHASANDLQRATSCTVTVSGVDSQGNYYTSTATISCETCTSAQVCAAAYAQASSVVKA